MIKKVFILFAVVFMVSACSYRFVGSHSGFQGGISKIYISSVTNATKEPNLDVYLKGDLVNVLNLDSRVSLTDKQDANGYLDVSITSYDISSSAFNANGTTSMYRCTIGVSVSLKSENGYIIKDKSLKAYRNYNASDIVSATEKARLSVAKEVLQDLAQKIDDELFVGF